MREKLQVRWRQSWLKAWLEGRRRLKRGTKLAINIGIILLAGIGLWGLESYPLPTARMEFRRLERTYLAEPSQIVLVSAKGMDGEFQAEDGTWLMLSRPLVVGILQNRAAVGYSLRGGHP